MSNANVKKEIRDLDAVFMEGINHQKIAAMVPNFYAEDGVLIAPGAPQVQGHAGITALLTGWVSTGVRNLRIDNQHIESSGDLAYVRGMVFFSMPIPTGAIIEAQSRYVCVYRRNRDSKLRAVVDILSAEQQG
jgi:ketosteroid isomerase-like protein